MTVQQQQTRAVPTPRPVLLAALLLVVGLLSSLLAAPASAHARFEASDPAEGAVLTELPATVVMTYSEAIAPEFVDTAVVPPGGDPVTTQAAAAGADVRIDLGAPEVTAVADQAGTWQVLARVVSADGHPVEHTTTFELQPAAAPAEPTKPIEPIEPTELIGATGSSETSEPGAAGTADAATADEGTEGTSETAAAASPAPLDDDPVAAVTDGMPGWVAVLVALAAVAAVAGVVVSVLRRRPPGA